MPDYWDQEEETQFAWMPGVTVGTRLFQAIYLNAKAGAGAYEYRRLVQPKYSERSRSSYFLGLSLYQGF